VCCGDQVAVFRLGSQIFQILFMTKWSFYFPPSFFEGSGQKEERLTLTSLAIFPSLSPFPMSGLLDFSPLRISMLCAQPVVVIKEPVSAFPRLPLDGSRWNSLSGIRPQLRTEYGPWLGSFFRIATFPNFDCGLAPSGYLSFLHDHPQNVTKVLGPLPAGPFSEVREVLHDH